MSLLHSCYSAKSKCQDMRDNSGIMDVTGLWVVALQDCLSMRTTMSSADCWAG